jgi:hypothetical protein
MLITMGVTLLQIMALASLAVGLVSCAAWWDLSADITRLRSDLNANAEALAKISARVDELERRQSGPDRVSAQTQQELTQAIEVLLKKALVTESRLTAIESGGVPSRVSDKLAKQTRPPSPDTNGIAVATSGDQHSSSLSIEPSSPPQKPSSPQAKRIRLGMLPEDVRRLLGEPISIETSESYIFWQYSPVSNQKYVIFDKGTKQVSGWWGL